MDVSCHACDLTIQRGVNASFVIDTIIFSIWIGGAQVVLPFARAHLAMNLAFSAVLHVPS
jgi:hypothetical protein